MYAQLNSDSIAFSSDTTKVSAYSEYKLAKFTEKIKIPLWKKDGKKRLWVFPALAWNNYDKTQLGIVLALDKEQKYSVFAIPMYGTGSKNLTGIVKSSFYFEGKQLDQIELNINAMRFSYLLFPEDLTFNKVQGRLSLTQQFNFKGYINFAFTHASIWQEYLLGGRNTSYFFVNKASISHHLNWKEIQNKSQVTLTQLANFGLIQVENKLQYQYNKHNKLYVRAYLGAFLYNTKASSNILPPLPILQLSGSSNTGIYWLQKDYAFDDFYIDRNAADPFFSKQVAPSEGGFLSATSIGNVNSYLFATNLKTDIMLPAKVKWWVNAQPYLNFAVGAQKNSAASIYAEGGVSVLLFREILGFHVPFVSTTNIKQNQVTAYGISDREWPKRITFSLNLQKLFIHKPSGINH